MPDDNLLNVYQHPAHSARITLLLLKVVTLSFDVLVIPWNVLVLSSRFYVSDKEITLWIPHS